MRALPGAIHSTEKPVTTMLTYPWKCTVLHCNHLGNTWKPLVLMTRHFDYCPSTSEGDNQSVGSSAPVVSRCFPGGYNVKLYISRGRLAWWLLTFLHSDIYYIVFSRAMFKILQVPPQYDIIVVCCGIGSRHLLSDKELTPVRGQVMRVTAPGLKHFIIDDDKDAYILPW